MTTIGKKAAIVCNTPETVDRVFAKGRREQLDSLADVYPRVITQQNIEEHLADLRDVEALFSTWGMFAPTDPQLDAMANLGAVFYAAGSVKGFAQPFLRRGIRVVSSWGANAVPVAEFALAQILLANKNYFQNIRQCSTPTGRSAAAAGPGNFGETVAILGAGMIGRRLIGLLKPFTLHIVVWDPFLTPAEADALGVEKVGTLPEAFARALVVSNHLANVPQTRGLLDRALFENMRPNATFINTGRGATVVEHDLAEVFGRRTDLIALLDVTCPEPPEPDSPLYELPNVHITSHIAGSTGDEVVRMADYAIAEFEAWRDGKALSYEVTPDMLDTMA